MNRLLHKLAERFVEIEKDRAKLVKYNEMMQTEGWKAHQEMLVVLQGLILQDMLSSQFSEMDASKKDVMQRAYAGVNEVLIFLMNPLAKAGSIAQIKRHNNAMEATKRKRPKGE